MHYDDWDDPIGRQSCDGRKRLPKRVSSAAIVRQTLAAVPAGDTISLAPPSMTTFDRDTVQGFTEHDLRDVCRWVKT